MANLKRFTTQYKGADDRILLTGEDNDGNTVSLWLTQRLLLKTIPVLVDWLQKNNPADLKTRDNSAQAQEMAEVFSRKPVQPKVTTIPAQEQAPSTENGAETDRQDPLPDPVVVHSVDVNLNARLLRMRLRQDEQELAHLAMNGKQLRQWLAVLQVLWKNAGWPQHVWPRWLTDDVKLVSNETRGNFH